MCGTFVGTFRRNIKSKNTRQIAKLRSRRCFRNKTITYKHINHLFRSCDVCKNEDRITLKIKRRSLISFYFICGPVAKTFIESQGMNGINTLVL